MRQKQSRLKWEGMRGGTGRSRWSENHSQDISQEKRIYFQSNEKIYYYKVTHKNSIRNSKEISILPNAIEYLNKLQSWMLHI